MELKDIFRKAMSHFASGITVVTAHYESEVHGMTCSAFFSLTLEPPSVLVSLSKKARTQILIEKSQVFAVNLLASSQSHYSDRFAGRHKEHEQDRFHAIAWKKVDTGAPVISGTLGFFDCKVRECFEASDHRLYWGEVIACALDETKLPLVYAQGGYGTFHGLSK